MGHGSSTPQRSHVEWTLERRSERHTVTLENALCGAIDDIESRRLVHVLPEYVHAPLAIHALTPNRRDSTARVRALDTFVTSHFAERAARCEAWLKP